MRLPLIVGFGGVGPAGRSSFHHAYRRTVLESLSAETKRQTLISLAALMGLRAIYVMTHDSIGLGEDDGGDGLLAGHGDDDRHREADEHDAGRNATWPEIAARVFSGVIAL